MTLATRSVTVELRRRPVLANASVTIAPGRITGIIGPNGAGKSTLLKALAGLVPPASGEVQLDGRPLTDFDRRSIAQRIAYLPQERTVHWPLAVRNIVALGRLPHGAGAARDGPRDRDAIAAAMHAMQVEALADRPADHLSGGELARVLLARALAQETPIILADEPTAGLDPAHALAFFELLRRLAADGRAIAVAVHDLSAAARFCHDVVLLARGCVLASGPAGDVLTAERLGPAYGVRMLVGQLDELPVVLPAAALP